MDSDEKALRKGMTAKQVKFCEQYLIDLNAAQAMIRAGYSPKDTNVTGSENLAKPRISSYIAYLREKQSKRTEITADKILAEYARIAFQNLGDVIDGDGKMKSLNEWSRDDLAAVSEITEDIIGGTDDGPVTKRKVRMLSKQAALDALSKHKGLFTENIHLSGSIDLTGMTDEQLMDELKDDG